jgi:hypothetical protein
MNMIKELSLVMIIILMAITSGCVANNSYDYTEEQSKKIAIEFVENSPTYSYDGSKLEHVETLTVSDESWIFVFSFESNHAGYGDRTGQVLAQVITPHTAAITVEKGKVVSAVLDDKWNVIEQEMVN